MCNEFYHVFKFFTLSRRYDSLLRVSMSARFVIFHRAKFIAGMDIILYMQSSVLCMLSRGMVLTARCSGDVGRIARSSLVASTCKSRGLGTSRSIDGPEKIERFR